LNCAHSMCNLAECALSARHRGKDNGSGGAVSRIGIHSLVFPREANNPPQRLNALAGNRCIYLNPDRLGSLVTKLFGGKRFNLLCRGLGGTSKNNPLQRNEKDPFHAVSPALDHLIMACRRSTGDRSCLVLMYDIILNPIDDLRKRFRTHAWFCYLRRIKRIFNSWLICELFTRRLAPTPVPRGALVEQGPRRIYARLVDLRFSASRV
jgi:hypothetical protein